MKEIDEFLEFLMDHKEDDRLLFSKKMKYGHRYYHINFMVDDEPDAKSSNNMSFRYRDTLEIIFDNRNQCIEIIGSDEPSSLIIEDVELLKKWCDKLEVFINDKLDSRVMSIFENTLNNCYNKNLHREYQMKKILPEDESL